MGRCGRNVSDLCEFDAHVHSHVYPVGSVVNQVFAVLRIGNGNIGKTLVGSVLACPFATVESENLIFLWRRNVHIGKLCEHIRNFSFAVGE